MRMSMRCGAAFWLGATGVAMMLASRPAPGQQMAGSVRSASVFGTTVSVATLRIPEKAWRHFARAKAAAAHHRLAESDRETEKAIAIAPDFAEAYLLRATAEIQERSYDAAVADVKEARRVEPDAMWSGVLLAGAYNGLDRYEDARRVLSELQGAEAETWQAAYEGARAAVGLADKEQALSLSALALNSAPDSFPDARLVRANALIVAQHWSEAQAQMEAFLRLKIPDSRRDEVLMSLNRIKQRGREEETQQLASR